MLVGVPVGERPAGGTRSVATVVISDLGEGDRHPESSDVKVSVGWGETRSDPPGRRANRQAVAQANRSIAPKTPTHRKRMMGIRECRAGELSAKASIVGVELSTSSRWTPRGRRGRHAEKEPQRKHGTSRGSPRPMQIGTAKASGDRKSVGVGKEC